MAHIYEITASAQMQLNMNKYQSIQLFLALKGSPSEGQSPEDAQREILQRAILGIVTEAIPVALRQKEMSSMATTNEDAAKWMNTMFEQFPAYGALTTVVPSKHWEGLQSNDMQAIQELFSQIKTTVSTVVKGDIENAAVK